MVESWHVWRVQRFVPHLPVQLCVLPLVRLCLLAGRHCAINVALLSECLRARERLCACIGRRSD